MVSAGRALLWPWRKLIDWAAPARRSTSTRKFVALAAGVPSVLVVGALVFAATLPHQADVTATSLAAAGKGIALAAKDAALPVLGFLVAVAVTAWLIHVGVVKALGEEVIRPVGRGVGRGALSFRDVLKLGYKSVKSNTCPRVVVEEEDE